VEYEWKPPSCDKCKVFGHSCSKLPPIASEKGKDSVVAAQMQPATLHKAIAPIAADKDKASSVMATHLQPAAQNKAISPTDPSTSTQVVSQSLVVQPQPSTIDKPIISLPTPITEPEGVAPSRATESSLHQGLPKAQVMQPPLLSLQSSSSTIPSNKQTQPQVSTTLRQGPVLEFIPEEVDGGSDQDSACDPLSVEESQHLITGYANCMESKMASIESGSESSTSTTGTLLDISSLHQGITLPSSPKSKKKKGEEAAKGLRALYYYITMLCFSISFNYV
jgi:hypothetical protein